MKSNEQLEYSEQTLQTFPMGLIKTAYIPTKSHALCVIHMPQYYFLCSQA